MDNCPRYRAKQQTKTPVYVHRLTPYTAITRLQCHYLNSERRVYGANYVTTQYIPQLYILYWNHKCLSQWRNLWSAVVMGHDQGRLVPDNNPPTTHCIGFIRQYVCLPWCGDTSTTCPDVLYTCTQPTGSGILDYCCSLICEYALCRH